jgi:hypothetical protein
MQHRTWLKTGLIGITVVALASCGDPKAEATVSPLNAIWGEPVSQAEQRAQQLHQEESVAACMKGEGWEYTPIDWAAQFNDQPEYEDPSAPGYGEKYGYGVVRNFELYELPYLDENGQWTEEGGMRGDSVEDPNTDYLNSLSPDEQTEYYATMYGDQSSQEPEIDPDTGEQVWISPPLEEQGCYGKAQLEVYGEQAWNNQDFNDRYAELTEELENDVAIDDAEITWSDCMYDANPDYDFFGPNDTWTYAQNMLNEVRGMEPMELGPIKDVTFDSAEASVATMAPMPVDGGPGGGGNEDLRLPTEAELREVQEQEIALWKVDDKCQDESGLRDIRKNREQQIADELRQEFPQYIEGEGE